jgi:hypothetical protein
LIPGKVFTMNKWKEKVQDNLPFLFLLCYLILIHWHLRISNDDVFFAKQTLSFEFLKQRYLEWSSRLITESILVFVMHFPFKIWKIIDIIMTVFCIKGLTCLFWEKPKYSINKFVCILLCLLYPIQELNNAGWAATTVNYLWPITLCLPSFIADKKILQKQYVSKKFLASTIITLIIGTDVEFAWAFSLFMTCVAFLLIKGKKNVFTYYFLKLLVLLLSFAKIILCPGNKIRFIEEIGNWFPDYLTLSLFDKIYLGSVSTASYLLNRSNLIVGVIVALLLYLSYRDNHSILLKGYAIFLLIFKILGINAINQDNIWSFIYGGERITIMNATKPGNYISFILSGLVLISIMVMLLILYGYCKKTLYLLGWYCAGLGARMIMIFSPTLFASSLRTFLPLDISLIGIAIVLCRDIFIERQKLLKERKIL